MGEQPVRPSWDSIADAYRRWIRGDMIERDLTSEELAAALKDAEELTSMFDPNTGLASERPNAVSQSEEAEALRPWDDQE